MKQASTHELATCTTGSPAMRAVPKALLMLPAMLLVASVALAGFPTCTPPVITATTPASVCGFGDISLAATASSGTISWYSASSGGTLLHTGSTFNTFVSSTTTFYVEATDGGCTSARTAVTATANPKPTATATAGTSSACVGNTLSLSGSGSGGTSPYTYSWTGPNGYTSSSSSSSNASNGPLTLDDAGFYTMVVTDANGCTGSNSALVSVYSNPTLDVVATPNPVCTGNTLSLSSGFNSGGSGVATYTWTGPNSYSSTSENPMLNNASSSCAGVYTVMATDSHGCIGYGTTSTVSVITNTVSITASGDVTICQGASATLNTSGGSTYDWNPGTGLSPTTGSTVTASPSATTTYVVTGHVGNCYNRDSVTVIVLETYSVTAASPTNGTISEVGTTSVCSGTDKTYTITPNSGYHISDVQVDGTSIGNTPPFTIYNVTAPHTITATFAPDCTTPSITATTSGAVCGSGTVSLAATASAGTINWYSSSTGGSSLHTGSTYAPSITSSTTYYVDATDGSCVSTRTAVNASVNSNPTATATPTNVSCYGQATGSVAVSGSGGSGSYTVSGDATSALAAGTYNYTVTDGNGCSATVSATVTQPSSAVAVSTSVTNVLCHGGNSGSVTVSATGGVSPYTGAATYNDLTAGSFSYTVTDANGCTATATGTISEPATLAAGSAVTNVLCHGGNSGSVTVSATGGVSPYTGTGSFTGLTAGSFSYTVTDANGCTSSASGSISEPSASLSASTSVTDASCYGGNNGSVVVSATGGTSPYTGTGTVSNLTAGTYNYTVTDANGCTASASATVSQPSALSVSLTPTNISCNSSNSGNHSNGAVSCAVSGGTSAYTYAWSNSSTASGLSGLSAGTYSVTVTDANSCTATASATVGEPSAITIGTSVTNVSCSGAAGSISTTVSGGTGSYSYTWSNSGSSATNSGLAAGTYSVTVTDASSCSATTSATVGAGSSISSTITGSTSVLGSTTSTFTGPSGMSTYSWSITGGDHVCDAQCHHNSGHSCGYGCDHYGHSCSSACHHHSSHSCTNGHLGDHHCSIYCHHNSGHSCNANCDHYGISCTSACHHHSSHHCGHQHCGGPSISGSATGSSVNISNPCCAASYTVSLTVTNSAGCSSSSSSAITVTPSATITVYSNLYTVGSGNHPGVTKSALASSLKVFTRSTGRRRNGNQSDYASMWNSTTGLVSNAIISGPSTVTMGGGPGYMYTITVPANQHYIVVGKSTVSSTRCGGTTCTIYTGRKVGGTESFEGDEHGRDDDDDDELGVCNTAKVRFHSVVKDQTGKCFEADTHQEHGSLMLVVSPMALDFTDSVAYLPVVYESVEGDWDVSVSAEPPYGFYADPATELSTNVTDSVMNAVQFAIVDTGSEWTFTKLTHQIQHKGEQRIAHTNPAMVNSRTNKPTQLNITPNPANDQIRIVLPGFEGRATVYVYNLMGQVVAEHPIDVISGASVSMDISSLVPGVYLVSAENTSGKATTRLIKGEK